MSASSCPSWTSTIGVGTILMIRTDDLKLINGSYCALCGQRYRINSSFDGDELEQQLRQASTEE